MNLIMKASNILKIADIEDSDLPREFTAWLQANREPIYRDQVLKEHLYGEELFDENEQAPPAGVVSDTAQQIVELCRKKDCGYFRIIS